MFKIWGYAPEAKIKYRKGLVASFFWAVAVLIVGFLLCKWGIQTGKISYEVMLFIGLLCIVAPFQIINSKFNEIAREKLKSLYVFIQDELGNLSYIYLSSDAFLDTAGLRTYQMDTLRYRNFIFKMIQNYQNNKNREILLANARDNHIIEKLYQEGRLDKVATPIHRVEDVKKYGNYIVITCRVGNIDNSKKKIITIYNVIDDFEELYEKITTKANGLNV